MKDLLKDIQDYMEQDDGFRQRSGQYTRAMKSEEWQFLNHAILIIKGKMMEDMLSLKHTNSDPYDKDVTQRTYYNINRMLDFLTSPEAWLKKRHKVKQAYANMSEKVIRQFKSGGKR